MSKQLILLGQRRECLMNEIAVQRGVLAQSVAPWRAPLALADRGIAGLQYISRHPQWIIGIVALLVILRPAPVARWVGRGLLASQMLNRRSKKLRKPLATG